MPGLVCFHAGNYAAANKHVCQWFVWDGSCSSGLTPRAVDTLNDTGKAAYTLAPADSCPLHAAYEDDTAVGSSTDETQCHKGKDIRSRYNDGGYKWCTGPVRSGYKFTADPQTPR